jgi:hypothetical protein
MSSLAISANPNPAFAGVALQAHHRGGRGPKADVVGASNVGQVGQLPVGVGQGLLGGLVQSLQQAAAARGATAGSAIGGAAATGTATTTSTGAAVTPNIAQDLHSFTHALFQALNATGASGTTSAAGGGQYQAGLASSLQSLIQQVSAGGAQTPAVAGLTASFHQLTQDLGASGSQASLQTFLSGYLHTVQGGGHVMPNLVGTNLNAQV